MTFSRLYRGGGRLLFTWPAQILMAGVALTGAVAFAFSDPDLPHAASEIPERPLFLLLLAMAFLLALLAHELGHALTTKAFGRKVLGLGVGWYWFGPMAFVDTSDMWLSPRWPRIAVTIAGSYANIILGGLASLVAFAVPHPDVQLGCFCFALGSYLIVLVNLNPLLEYDGYYVLTDVLERPHLRAQCLSWLGTDLPRALLSPRKLRGHAFEFLYGIGSLAYVLAMAMLTVLLYQRVLRKWVAEVLPGWIASGLAGILALLVVLACLLTVIGELRSKEKRI